MLKTALRRFGFRAVSVEEQHEDVSAGCTGRDVNEGAVKIKELPMDMGKFASKGFIKPEHLAEGPEIVKITAIEEGKYNKPVLIFADGRRLSLNATNTSTLIKEFGTKDGAAWIGREAELYVGPLAYNGAISDAVLVRAPKAPAKPAAPTNELQPDPIPF
jgi:hypothetical protein